MKATETVRAALYGRKSTTDAARPGKSVSDQLREARAEAKRRGYVVAAEYADDGVSASRHGRKPRPGFAALLAGIEAGDVDVVVLAEQSRATRRLSTLGALIELCADSGVRLVIGGRDVDPSDSSDQLMLGITGAVDVAESERARARTKRGMRGAAEAGRQHGKLAYGYARTYDPTSGALLRVDVVPDEAAVVRELVDGVLSGRSLYSLSRELTERGVPVPRDAVALRQGRESSGAKWNGTSIRRVASNPLYAGLRVHLGEVVGDGDWPAIVTRSEHEAVAAIFAAPQRRRREERPGAVKHLLSGIATCGVCGGRLRVLRNRGRYSSYVCHDRWCVSRQQAGTEQLVVDVVLGLVARPGFVEAVAAASDDSGARLAVERVEQLRARRDSVRASIVDGMLGVDDGAAILRELSAELDDAERAVHRIAMPRRATDVVPADLAERWDELDVAVRREIVAALVTVELLPTRKSSRFDPASVRVTPRA